MSMFPSKKFGRVRKDKIGLSWLQRILGSLFLCRCLHTARSLLLNSHLGVAESRYRKEVAEYLQCKQ